MRYFNLLVVLAFMFAEQSIIGQNVSVNQSEGEFYMMPKGVTQTDYQSKTVVFKIKSDYRSYCRNNGVSLKDLADVFSYIGANQIQKKFPNHKPPVDTYDDYGHKYADISLIYELKYTKEIPLEKVINLISSTKKVEYALPRFIPKPLYIPNDPDQSNQFYLNSVRAYQAWDISKGDTNIVIGITDSGTDFTHPDLIKNIKKNYFDPIDGIDNDNDGYIDNFRGWDVGENDNNPNVHASAHGVHVTGIAAASVDDSIGMAGVGFNTKFMPIKIDDEYASFNRGYEGIVYAADHGCDIINCSWGGRFGEGQFGQDIITYATINQNSLVVAACGNENNEHIYWPASYKYVLSVAATDSMDVLWAGSSYGKNIDICAPGTFIYSTWNLGYYVTSHGTSMAAPIVSACAAIVKSHYPNLSALQIAEQLKVTSDIIDTVNGNQTYVEKLGAGRANMYRALVVNNKPSVRLLNYEVLDSVQSTSYYDTLEIKCDFMNYLSATANLNVSLSTNSQYVNVVSGNLNLGVMQTMQSKNNYSSPFKIVVFPNIPDNYYVEFKLTYSDSSYNAIEWFSHIFHPEYLNIETEFISTTITSNSKIAYNDYYYSEGIGFIYKNGISLVSTSGLVIGSSSSKVMDNIVGDNGYDNDFTPVKKISVLTNPAFCDNAFRSVFHDSLSSQSKLNIEVIQDVYTCDSAQDAKFIIYDYNIVNKSGALISGLYAGIYADWELNPSNKNRISYDANHRMGYAYATTGGQYVGIKLLTSDSLTHYAFNNNGDNNSINIYDGLPNYEKFIALTTNRHYAGFADSDGGDVADMLSSGPFVIPAGDTVQLAFAIVVGDHLHDLRNSAQAAHDKYYNTASIKEKVILPDDMFLGQNYPNPCSETASIKFFVPNNEYVELVVYNLLGEKVKVLYSSNSDLGFQSVNFNTSSLDKGIYFYSLSTATKRITKKMTVY